MAPVQNRAPGPLASQTTEAQSTRPPSEGLQAADPLPLPGHAVLRARDCSTRRCQLLIKASDVPATVIAEQVGWAGSITSFRDNVRRLRPEHWPVDPADRLTWLPGDVV